MNPNHLSVGSIQHSRPAGPADAPFAAARLAACLRGCRASGELQASGSRTGRDADGDQPPDPPARGRPRSEEHTSELQSLMRISYAVFCLTKNKTKTNT